MIASSGISISFQVYKNAMAVCLVIDELADVLTAVGISEARFAESHVIDEFAFKWTSVWVLYYTLSMSFASLSDSPSIKIVIYDAYS